MAFSPNDHWAFRLAHEVLKRKEPYVITAGATLSGPLHIGTVCEFLFPWAIKKALAMMGKEAEFYFVADSRDAFDSIPRALEGEREKLSPHLGKPLSAVPDPFGCHESYSEHFLADVVDVMKAMGVEASIVRADEFYEGPSAPFHPYTLLYLKNEDRVKEIIEKTSGRQLPKDYSIIMPICEACGRIATTRVEKVELEGDDAVYSYTCDKDVGYAEGCGHRGQGRIREGRYKLQWRVHWPTWQAYFGTTIEGGGVDHFTKGGSWDTAKAIHREILGREPPIGYKYGFILQRGKKYSKSKDSGMSVKEMLRLIPPKVVAYHLLKYDLTENIDFVPTKENVLAMITDYENAAQLREKAEGGELSRAERKRWFSYLLAGEKEWDVPFRDVLLLYQIYRDWEKVEKALPGNYDYVKPFVEEWIRRGFVPDDYDFSYRPRRAEGAVREFLASLSPSMDAKEIHNAVYEFARSRGMEPKELFRQLYQTLIGKDRGPRLGRFIALLGVEKVKGDTGVSFEIHR